MIDGREPQRVSHSGKFIYGMRVYVDIEKGGDLHNFIMQYAAAHDLRMRQAYADFLERGRTAVEAEETETIEGTLDTDDESPLTQDEEEFARDLVEEKMSGESIDDHFDEFHETVQQQAQATDSISNDISPVLIRWYLVHYHDGQ